HLRPGDRGTGGEPAFPHHGSAGADAVLRAGLIGIFCGELPLWHFDPLAIGSLSAAPGRHHASSSTRQPGAAIPECVGHQDGRQTESRPVLKPSGPLRAYLKELPFETPPIDTRVQVVALYYW